MLNNDFMLRQANLFAARLKRQAEGDPAQWVNIGWELALGRKPNEQEKAKALEMFAAGDHDQALTRFCLLLFNLNEFITSAKINFCLMPHAANS